MTRLKRRARQFFDMFLLKRGYSTTTLFMCLCIFRLGNMQRNFPQDATMIPLRGPSGEIISTGYPNTKPGEVVWNVTVEEVHRIFLQFLDFEAVERSPCTLDNFELYDGKFDINLRVGRWCWDSFDKLTITTYTSRSNIFLLRFRAVRGFERKGFKANYSIIPKEATTTNTLNTVRTTARDEMTPTQTSVQTHTLSTTGKKEGSSSISTVISSGTGTIPRSTEESNSSTSSVTFTQTAMRTSNFITEPNLLSPETTKSTSSPSTEPNGLNSEKIYYVGAGCGILLIICLCCIGLCCCCFCRREKYKTKDSDKSNHIEFKALAPVGSVHSSGTLHERTTSDSHSNSHQSGFTEDKKSARPKSLGLEYSSPTYSMPDKKKRKELVTNSNISQQNSGNKKYGSPKLSSDTLYATPHGGKPDSSEFEINVAYQSCGSEEETGSNMAQDITAYSYVDNKNGSKDKSKAAPRDKFDDVTYDVPEGEEGGEDGLVSNIAYQSFDVENEQFEEDGDVEMATNVAYQSCDSEEENIGKSDATYYYLDDKGSEKQEEQKDIVYESV